MTAPNEAAQIEREPVSSKFGVGRFDDGSGPRVTVEYDITTEHLPENIWIDEYAASFHHECAEEVCAAIMRSAKAIRQHLKETDNG